ncbi:MAG TPA: peptide ABC transporter permease, partial [Acidimicrobiaceae bacterium]|nr:peptide ABC transporter permease [Acidimicrobiaceae bacterium]
MIVFVGFGWMGLARLVRGQVLAIREMEFVEAARALGVPPLRIALRHILPNAIG